MKIHSGLAIWYHDESEVDPDHSWLANSAFLVDQVLLGSFDSCRYSRVLALTEYAQPDFILTINGEPLLSVEVTRMNPSGHNLPQRFSCLVRAAELGIPSLFYYPMKARRTASDPNVRFLNVRVPIAQLRLSELFLVPSLSMFWPTDPETHLPASGISEHRDLAAFVEYVAQLGVKGERLRVEDPLVKELTDKMKSTVFQQGKEGYQKNASFRKLYPKGDTFTTVFLPEGIDPPNSCSVVSTELLLNDIYIHFGFKGIPDNRKTCFLKAREHSLIYNGTPNRSKDGPEHPYPGYLTLLDILYLRTDEGQTTRDRYMNLVFRLPISLTNFTRKALDRPTGLNILMEFADLILLEDAVVLGGWMRNLAAGAVLIK